MDCMQQRMTAHRGRQIGATTVNRFWICTTSSHFYLITAAHLRSANTLATALICLRIGVIEQALTLPSSMSTLHPGLYCVRLRAALFARPPILTTEPLLLRPKVLDIVHLPNDRPLARSSQFSAVSLEANLGGCGHTKAEIRRRKH
jgi:hypothetical protein